MAAVHVSSLCNGGKTGDLKNNVVRLLREIERMKLQAKVDMKGWCVGTPSSFLPVMHSALVQYSLPLAEWLMVQGYNLYGKSDLKFIEGVYRVLRQVFSYRPKLTKEQFLAKGYAERKVMLTCDLLCLCQAKHLQLTSAGKKTKKRAILSSVGGKKREYGPENNPPEVLTVREGAGVGSAWREHIPIHTYAYDEPQGQYSHTPHPDEHSHTPHPDEHSHTPHPDEQVLHLPYDNHMHAIPVPGHTLPTHQHISPVQSPTKLSNVPTPVSSHLTSVPSPSPPSPSPSPHPSSINTSPLSVEPEIKVEQDSDYMDMCITRSHVEGEGEEVRNWRPLPLASDKAQKEDTDDLLLMDLSTRVGQLAKLVEQMSARFVLVETQLMLARTQGRGEKGKGEKDPLHMLTRGDNNRPHLPAPGEMGMPERLSTHCEPTPARVVTPGPHNRTTPRPDTSPHSSPFLDNNRPRGATRGRGHPLSAHSHLPPTTSPNPEETQQLILNLRSRAQKTRLFLQQANTSSGTGRDV